MERIKMDSVYEQGKMERGGATTVRQDECLRRKSRREKRALVMLP